jgi:hypothetical protein
MALDPSDRLRASATAQSRPTSTQARLVAAAGLVRRAVPAIDWSRREPRRSRLEFDSWDARLEGDPSAGSTGMDWNDPWIAGRVFALVIVFIFILIWAEAKFKEEDPRKKKREEEEERRKERDATRRRTFRGR